MFWLPVTKHRTEDIQNAPLPADYRYYLADPEYVAREASSQKGFSVVRLGSALGVSWKYGPFRFERYVGDEEPAYDATGPLRLVTWQRVMRKETPAGWKESHFVMRTSRTGFATVEKDGDYTSGWSSHAKRHRKNWLKQADWQIVPISQEEYIAAYKRSRMDSFLKFLFTNLLKQKTRGHGERVHIFGAKRLAPHSPTEAGFAFVDVPETKQSIHLMSFHNDAARPVSAGTGLMDAWYAYAREHDIRYLEFGCFWTPGEPSSWKGFTQFKSQFGLQFIDYPRPLSRWMGDRKRMFG